MIGSKLEIKIFHVLVDVLSLEPHRFVYRITNHWGSGKGLGKFRAFYNAACDIQKMLIDKFGYLECPYCQWAMRYTGEHRACELHLINSKVSE